MLELVRKGVPIREVNVGNMHFSEGKKQISSRVYADEADVAALKELEQRTERLYFQDVPAAAVEHVTL